MAKSTIYIRVDGSPEIGLGHIYRGIALAYMIEREYRPYFLLREDSVITPIKDAGFDFALIPTGVKLIDEPEWLENNLPAGSVIVFDGYDFDDNYQKRIKDRDFKFVYIDDLKKYHIFAHWVINHSPEAHAEDYQTEEYTGFALGTKYALLRREFLEATTEHTEYKPSNSAFVCFGGSDYYDMTYKVVKLLLEKCKFDRVDVVLGNAYKHKRIYDLARYENNKVFISRDVPPSTMVELIRSSDIAIVPSSTVLYEVAAVGKPVLCGYYADNQKNIYKSFTEKGAALGIGKWQDASFTDIEKAIKTLKLKDPESFIKQQRDLIDGKSGERVLKIFGLINLKIRDVSPNDVDLLYEWVNDPDVRRNAINSKKIDYNEHVNWFKRVLNSEKTYIFILEKDHNAVGQIRFDWDDRTKAFVIDYSIDRRYRGNGYGKEIVRLGMFELRKKSGDVSFVAIVRQGNNASLRVFEGLGFIVLSRNEQFVTFVYNKKK